MSAFNFEYFTLSGRKHKEEKERKILIFLINEDIVQPMKSSMLLDAQAWPAPGGVAPAVQGPTDHCGRRGRRHVPRMVGWTFYCLGVLQIKLVGKIAL